jgi:protein O-mannosyl-transferase
MTGQEPSLKRAAETGRENRRWTAPAVCFGLALITLVVFGQTVRHDFIGYDDNEYVYENPVVAQGLTLRGLMWAFSGAHALNWHPLTWLSHMLDCQLYGLHPSGHHLTNVLLHAATAIALFLMLQQMTGVSGRSAFVAALFAIHPLRVESVAWVSERKDVLSGLFFMLTIAAYVRYARQPWSLARYGLVVLLFAMGLMSKPMLVTLPLVLLLLDYWPLRRAEPARKLALEKLPMLALSAASSLVTVLAQKTAMQSTEFLSLPARCASALVSCVVYLVQMVYPVKLAVFYPFPHALSVVKVGVAGVVLVGVSIIAWLARRKQPWLLAGWLWYLVMLLPVLGIIQVGAQAHADRYTYLPQIGIYIAVIWLTAEWCAKWRVAQAAQEGLATVVLAVLMVCAWKQTAYWQNSETLSAHALACTTDNYITHVILGNSFMSEGREDDAISQFQQALQINSTLVMARNNLGNALLHQGKVDEGIIQYQEAIKIKPNFAEAHFNLANALCLKGRDDEAIGEFEKALEINPHYAEACNNLGRTLCKKGRVDDGIAQFQQALEINPAFVDAHNNLGNALLEKGRVDDAIACYQRALALDPNYARARKNLEEAVLRKQSPLQEMKN